MSEQMTIDCPSCGSPLLVPESAAGRKARCTACDTRFVIPSMEEMLEQTVSHLVLEELDARWHEDDMDAESSQGRAAKRPETPISANGTVLGMPVTPTLPNRSDDSSTVLSIDNLSDQPPDTTPEPDADRRKPELRHASEYPTDLRPTEPRPYLVVRNVSMKGVVIAFAAEWLNHETFRTSLPLRCVVSGSSTKSPLSCRPVIFANRIRGEELHARGMEVRYEMEIGAGFSPRSHSREIGRMDNLTAPFDRPLLYYVKTGLNADAIKARVSTGEDGRDVCEVTIPHGEVGLDWLSRVNGRCGIEYALLKTEVATYTNNAWSSLSERTRRRIETWCQFSRGERFRLYLNDADLTVADEGLGGVVVTDQRLLHHKFRRSRSISLNQDATLHLRTDDKFTRLTLESGGRLARAGKIHRSDMNALIEALADAARLKVMVGKVESASSET